MLNQPLASYLASYLADGLRFLASWIGVSAPDQTSGSGGRPASGVPARMPWPAADAIDRRWAIAFALVVAAIAWWWLNRGIPVEVFEARRGSAAEVVYATGVIEPVHWAKVTALQRKRIVEICKCEGKEVSRGDVLVRLDDAQERAALSELQARLERLQADADRTERLVQRNIAARTILEEKLTQVEEHQARVAAQRERIADLALKAPVDGVVLRRDGEVGEIAGIGAQDTLLWVGQPKPLRVVAEINEDDILRVKPGQKVLLRHEGQPDRPMYATVDRLTPKGDPDTKTFRAYLALPDDTPLRIGMSVEANIIVEEVQDGILVRAEALHDGKVIRIVDGERARITPIETGIKGKGLVEIRSGLAAGDRVVSPFDPEIENGALLRIENRTP